MTLTDFLLARIAEDECDAQDSLERGFGGWEWLADGGINFEARTHIVRWHPARVLAECEAKRRIVEALVDAEDAVAQFKEPDVTTYPSYWQEWGNRHALRLAVELLALPYADHPDYREEWRT